MKALAEAEYFLIFYGINCKIKKILRNLMFQSKKGK